MYPQNTPDRPDRGHTSNPSSTKNRPVGASSASKRRSTKKVGSIDVGQQQQVRQLPRNNSVPAWLKSLLAVQRVSLVLFCSVLGLSSIVYSYTVYTQDAWKISHGKLRRLQKQERQQGVMNENLKQEMAIVAEQPNSGLVSPSPTRIVVVPKAPQRPTKALATAPSPSPSPSPSPTPSAKLPLGY
jgi:hypothetical protein